MRSVRAHHVTALVGRMQANEAPYRADAARRLAGMVPDGLHHRYPEIEWAVRAALRDPDPRVRRSVAWLVVLRARWNAFQVNKPVDIRKDFEVFIRIAYGSRCIDWFDDDDVSRLLDDPDAPVRLLAADVMACTGDRRAVPALLEVLGDRSPENRTRAVATIGVLLSKLPDDQRPEVVDQVLPAMLTALEKTPEHLLQGVVRALGETRDPRAAAALTAASLPSSYDVWRQRSLQKIAPI